VWVVASRDDGIFCGKFAKAAEHLRQHPRRACSPEFRSRHGCLYRKLEPRITWISDRMNKMFRIRILGSIRVSRVVVASSRRRTLFIQQKFAKAEHLRQHPPPSPTSLRIKVRRVERLRPAKETGALPRISLQTPAQILIHLPSHSRENG
jgi:hypothetical protein